VRDRLRISLVAWMLLVAYAVFHGLSNDSPSLVPVYVWQIALVATAIWLALQPLIEYLRVPAHHAGPPSLSAP